MSVIGSLGPIGLGLGQYQLPTGVNQSIGSSLSELGQSTGLLHWVNSPARVNSHSLGLGSVWLILIGFSSFNWPRPAWAWARPTVWVRQLSVRPSSLSGFRHWVQYNNVN